MRPRNELIKACEIDAVGLEYICNRYCKQRPGRWVQAGFVIRERLEIKSVAGCVISLLGESLTAFQSLHDVSWECQPSVFPR